MPFTQLFPYDFGGAGDINSTVEDMARWVRLQLGNGTFEGHRIVSAENLAFTRTPKVALSDKASYAMGWVIQQTPNGNIVWHNGGTAAFGAFVGMAPDKNIGVIVLTNETNVGFPDAIGRWILDRCSATPKSIMSLMVEGGRNQFQDCGQAVCQTRDSATVPSDRTAGWYVHQFELRQGNGGAGRNGLVMELQATGAKLQLEPWDGDIFTARLIRTASSQRWSKILVPLPNGFVQFQIDKSAKLNLLRFSFDDGQTYEFHRE